MNKVLIFVFVAVACLSCGPDDAIPQAPVTDDFDPATARLLRSGKLEGVNHSASGTVSLYEHHGMYTVLLDPFQSENGPDLKVYLSKSVDASEYVSLGKLKSITGKQSYAVLAGTKPDDYPFVLIWCEKFSVIFAKSEPK